MNVVKERLKQALSQRQKRHIANDSLVPAAVLLPIYYNRIEGQYYILFTRRTEWVKEHKGQISFPGGAYEERDGTLVNTALRECAEEIGLRPDGVEVLGELDDEVVTVSNYVVTPFVALIPWPYRFEVDVEEVKEIIEVPIHVLMDRDCLQRETEIIDGEAVDFNYYCYKELVIWGATARILNQFLAIFARIMEGE